MLEYFPERRKSSTDLLPLPKAMQRRSPSPSKRSFSDLLTPFFKKSQDDSNYYMDKQEPNAKRPAKLFPSIRHKISVNNANCDSLSQYLQEYDGREINEKSDDPYSFIDELSADLPAEILQLKEINPESSQGQQYEKTLILLELLTSEIVYLKQLYYVITKPMFILNSTKEQFFPNFDINAVFGNIVDVFRSNVMFWTDCMEDVFQLIKASGTVPDIKHLIEGFNNIGKYFVPYKTYCANISSACEYISKQEEDSEAFKLFIEWCRNSDSSKRLGLDTFITMPFQRITRYSLFLERIAKEYTGDEDELERLCEAVAEVDKFVNSINKKIKVKDLTSKLHFSQNILNGFPTVEEYTKHKFPIPPFPAFSLMCPMQVKSEYEEEVRCLIHQETLQMKRLHKKTMVVKLLLFTDLMIIAKPIKKNQQCRLRMIEDPISLDQLILCDTSESTDESCFYLAQLNRFNCFTSIIKFSNAKSSSQKNAAQIFQRKMELAKVNYETLMSAQTSSNVHINVINPEELGFLKNEEAPFGVPPDQPSAHSSNSDNDSDCDWSDITSKSTSSNSWTDLENNLNSCIITDPFIGDFDHHDTLYEIPHKLSHRLSLQNVSDKWCRKKTDSLISFASDTSFTKQDGLWSALRRSSLGNNKVSGKSVDEKCNYD